jgi:hypothetical protein
MLSQCLVIRFTLIPEQPRRLANRISPVCVTYQWLSKTLAHRRNALRSSASFSSLFFVAAGDLQLLAIQSKSVNWPPPMSMSTVFGVTYYGYFRMRFRTRKAISYVCRNRKGIGMPVRP